MFREACSTAFYYLSVQHLLSWKMSDLGSRGMRGGNGQAGQAGRDGQPGPSGDMGATGAPGRDGRAGPAGPRGENGSAPVGTAGAKVCYLPFLAKSLFRKTEQGWDWFAYNSAIHMRYTKDVTVTRQDSKRDFVPSVSSRFDYQTCTKTVVTLLHEVVSVFFCYLSIIYLRFSLNRLYSPVLSCTKWLQDLITSITGSCWRTRRAGR